MGEQHVQESVDGSVVIYDPERGESKLILHLLLDST